jgi:membrane-associated phospholipid phosphatase
MAEFQPSKLAMRVRFPSPARRDQSARRHPCPTTGCGCARGQASRYHRRVSASDPTSHGPPEERLARRLEAGATPRRSAVAAALHELAEVDRAVYRTIASTPTPTLDAPLRRLSGLANHSKLWLAAAGVMAVFGGRAGRRAALTGVIAVGVNSALVNLPMKFASDRERPNRETAGVPEQRWVPMPTSSSFPSGHAASGFAFAGAVSGSMPVIGVPLRGLAAAVAYSRVHTGVHYPGDVIVGSLIGATIGEATSLTCRALYRRHNRSTTTTAACR